MNRDNFVPTSYRTAGFSYEDWEALQLLPLGQDQNSSPINIQRFLFRFTLYYYLCQQSFKAQQLSRRTNVVIIVLIEVYTID